MQTEGSGSTHYQTERLAQSSNRKVDGPPRELGPGGRLPGDRPPTRNPGTDDRPDQGPTGPRTPYPVDDPGIHDPNGPGSEPDYLPGSPSNPNTRF